MANISIEVAAVGTEIRRRRKGLGLTLAELAERSGLTANYIGTIEAGQRDPSTNTLLALAKALGCPPGDLLGVQDMSTEAVELARIADAIRPALREHLLKIARDFKELDTYV